jgi:hypothetical protein
MKDVSRGEEEQVCSGWQHPVPNMIQPAHCKLASYCLRNTICFSLSLSLSLSLALSLSLYIYIYIYIFCRSDRGVSVGRGWEEESG